MVSNSKILVAGGSGFIGKSLISELISNDNKVISISKNRDKKIEKIKNVNYIFHDLTKPFTKNQIKDLSDVEYIVNCSGYVDHRDFLNGGKNILNDHFESLYLLTILAIELKVKSFIHIGSSDEYGKNKSPINELSRESPESPYALGKLSSTHFLQQCFRQGILNTVVLRPFLVFGEKQGKNRFLPYLIDSCINDREFKVSKAEQIRDYLYIKDLNRAIIKTLNNYEAYGEVINIASGIPISLKEIIINVQEISGKAEIYSNQ